MNEFFVTYGFGSHLERCYSRVPADTIHQAWDKIFEVTGGKHAFIYTEEQFKGQPEKYDLREVALQPQIHLDDVE